MSEQLERVSPSPSLLKRIKGPSKLQRRLASAAAESESAALFMHTILCQTCLPYRDPGELKLWRRANGKWVLKVFAGEAVDPSGRDVALPLPFGPKARMLLMHMNQRAMLTSSPRVVMGDSLTHFVREVLRIDPNGHSMRTVKSQLARLAACRMQFARIEDDHVTILDSKIVKMYDLWGSKDGQLALWPEFVEFSPDYFTSLQETAVPLDEGHISALRHSAMALDVYSWLAQRLHRIKPGKPERISWPALHVQFGGESTRLDHFREKFRVALREVLTVYRSARVDECPGQPARITIDDGKRLVRNPPLLGVMLWHSPPPVPPRILPAGGKPSG